VARALIVLTPCFKRARALANATNPCDDAVLDNHVDPIQLLVKRHGTLDPVNRRLADNKSSTRSGTSGLGDRKAKKMPRIKPRSAVVVRAGFYSLSARRLTYNASRGAIVVDVDRLGRAAYHDGSARRYRRHHSAYHGKQAHTSCRAATLRRGEVRNRQTALTQRS